MNEGENKTEFLVSVVITAYNIEDCIERAIDSVLAQTIPPSEIIVVDDGSQDVTSEKIKSYGEKVRYVYQDNQGPSSARNTGIQMARYDWIAFLDGDDEWLPNNLLLHAAIHDANPELMWSTGNFVRCLCDEKRRSEDLDPARVRSLLGDCDYFSNYFLAHANRAAGHADTMVIHRQVFERVGGFDPALAYGEDIKLWWQITLAYPRVGFIAEPIAVYHLGRPGTLSSVHLENKIKGLVELLEATRSRAEQCGMSDQFELLIKFLVTSWIRGLLFKNEPIQIKNLINKFGTSLSPTFKLFVRILMVCPKGTAAACRMISKVVRVLKLRKSITRKPMPLSK